ncbi:hypothetical protein [Peribacillus sp. SI8-4]|uniref:hypothetical protein n=1 Tax=Peribacillus sp. SI8-4 TaxID=3048009 RepID=UPI0025541179|nr:hypothetical protein [Peribacillus sp. SI8-4]
MNIAETSYKLGKVIKKIDEGKELLDVIKITKEKTSPEAWYNFFKLVISNAREGLGHYYGIPNAYYLLEANKENQKNESLKKEIEEILSIPEYKKLVELGIYFGNAIEELHKDIIAPTIPKKFAGTVAKPKLKRKIQDLHVSVQRTGIVKYFLREFAQNQNSINIFSDYESKRSNYPFDKKNRLLIHQLARSNEEFNLLISNELISSVFGFMKRLIFEAHLELVIELNETEITSQVMRNISDFGIIRINTINPLLLNQGFTFRIVRQGEENFGFFNKKQSSYSQEAWNCKLSGYLYTQDDKDMFYKE